MTKKNQTHKVGASQGTNNNLKGINNSKSVEQVCQNLGYETKIKFTKDGWGINGSQAQIGCYIKPCKRFPKGLAIELIGQDSSGTGQNKIPYKLHSIIEAYPCPGVLVSLGDGRGLNRMVEWAKDQVGKHWLVAEDCDKLLGVFDLEQFEQWLTQVTNAPKTKLTPALCQRAIEVERAQISLALGA